MDDLGNVLWIGDEPVPAVVCEAAASRWEVVLLSTTVAQQDLPPDTVLAVVSGQKANAATVVRHLQAAGIIAVVLGAKTFESKEGVPVLHVEADVSPAELAARLETAATFAPVIKRMRNGLIEAEALAKEVSRNAVEIAEEMQIAQHLQQDFLPRQLPKIGPVRFDVRYLAASFVSGDIYDVSRLDETHIGFYVADAVGHGMPAALMTMFIKKALQTKRISGHTYEIIAPEEALSQLNYDLYRQKLSMCEFCTVVYGVIDTESLTCTISRAGHPPPIWMHADGSHEILDMPGSLLGILEAPRFESRTVQFQRGDRLLLFSDGAEEVICGKGHDKTIEMGKFIAPLTTMNKQDFLARLTVKVPPGGADDDVTLLLMEIE